MPRTSAQFKEMKDKRKAKILSACLYLFANKGFDETAVDDICKKSKCAHGLFYHYFASTEEALNELLSENEKWSLYIFNIESSGKTALKEVCKEISTLLKGKKDEPLLMMKLCLNLHRQTSVNKTVAIKAYSSYLFIKKMVREAQAMGEATQASLDQVTDMFIATLTGAIDARLYSGIEKYKPIGADVLLSSICK